MFGKMSSCLLGSLALLLILRGDIATAIGQEVAQTANFETVHTSNAAILNRLGLAPLQIPDGHHKKRLAGPEPPGLQSRIHQPYSRRHGHKDSHVYIVKLPASPPYYTIAKPHKSVKDEKLSKPSGNHPMGFQGNGKPAKVYHWNLPVVKKIGEKKRIQAQMRMDQARRKMESQQAIAAKVKNNLEKIHPIGETMNDQRYFRPTTIQASHRKTVNLKQRQRVRNNDKLLNYPEDSHKKLDHAKKNSLVHSDKTYRLEDSSIHRVENSNELRDATRNVLKLKKHRKKAAMSYYAPISTKSGSTSIHKNFPGNGKPKAFYVIEKSRKPVYYHPLLP